jgi:TonB family protein
MKIVAAFFAVLMLAADSVGAAETAVLAPMKAGDSWIYRVQTGARKPYRLEYQLNANRAGNLYLASTVLPEEQGQTRVWSLLYPISNKLCMYDFFGTGQLGLDDTCRGELEVGRTWTQKTADSVSSSEDNYVIAALENVQVPAGQYKAYRVEDHRTVTEIAYPGVPAPPDGYVKKIDIITWYTPGTGIVKGSTRITTTSGKLLDENHRELERFTPSALGLPVVPQERMAVRTQAQIQTPSRMHPQQTAESGCLKPAYPTDALRVEATGTVTMQFLVGIDGTVRDAKLKKSSGNASLDTTAMNALSKCRFKPAQVDGQPVEQWQEVKYVWSID